MKNPFKKTAVEDVVDRELRSSRMQLLEAESLLESWTAQRDMLKKRIERLEKESEK